MKKRILALLLTACMALSLMGLPALATEADNPFTDVGEDSPFLAGILYAVENGITKGTTPKTFSPYMLCTRAQIIAFLWRAWGSPEPADDNPFPDLEPEAYYYKAALWSYQMGLLDGTSFDAYAHCTRLEVVTYLWKLAGAAEAGESLPFADVSGDADAMNAVAWAVGAGVTNGTTETTFSPDKRCTRAQIVTFIYRARNLFEATDGQA